MESIQDTARALTSKPVQRAVVSSVILISGALTLLGFSAIASVLFFKSFLPDQIVTTPVHLQYGASLHPYGVVSLKNKPMKTLQDYDISLTISMPRSPANVERGNFMVNLFLLDADATALQARDARQTSGRGVEFDDKAVMFNSRRPAILPYVDPVVSLASRVLFLLYHIFLPSSESNTLTIPLAERVAFSKFSGVPSTAYVEIEAGQTIQTYSVALIVTAQLRGLRWLMFHHRLTTYIGLTLSFWLCECLFMVFAWAVWVATVGSSVGGGERSLAGKRAPLMKTDITEDDEDDEQLYSSDRPHTFPSYGRHPLLKHEPQVKREMEPGRAMADIPVAGAEADDEDEEASEDERRRRDSGLGTSYSEEGSSGVRRRTSRSRAER